MLSQLSLDRRARVDEQRIARALPAFHLLRFVLLAYCFAMTGWLIRTQELWTPFRPEAEALGLLAAIWFGLVALCGAAAFSSIHPWARFGAPLAAIVVLVALGYVGLGAAEVWLGGAVGWLIGISFHATKGWKALGKRPELAFEMAVRPLLRERSAILGIEDPLEAVKAYERQQRRGLAGVALVAALALSVLHLARRVPSLDGDLAAFHRLWNAHDLDSLRTWAVHSGNLDADLERLASRPEWQNGWPTLGSLVGSEEPVSFLLLEDERFPIWHMKAVLFPAGQSTSSTVLPIDWVRMEGEWRIQSFGEPRVPESRPGIPVFLLRRPDLPRRLGL